MLHNKFPVCIYVETPKLPPHNYLDTEYESILNTCNTILHPPPVPVVYAQTYPMAPGTVQQCFTCPLFSRLFHNFSTSSSAKPQQCYTHPLFPRCMSSAPLKTWVELKTGSCQEPATGTHRCPRSATAMGGIVLYCTGEWWPLQCIEKNEIPWERTPAIWPNVLQPINKPSA